MIRRIARSLTILRAVHADPRTPWYCRALLYLAIAYAVCPVDLIPDFIPVIGHLDDLVILPLLAGTAWLLLPRALKADHLKPAADQQTARQDHAS